MMEYKEYFAKVEFSDDDNIFHGEVINLRDVITFEGETVRELKKAFQDSVDDYLNFCAKRGEGPEKPYGPPGCGTTQRFGLQKLEGRILHCQKGDRHSEGVQFEKSL